MNRVVVIGLIAAGVVPALPAADRSATARLLLERLRIERQSILEASMPAPAKEPAIDLSPLIGVARKDIFGALGTPDFCVTPDTSDCDRSPHVVYFFYKFQPSSKALPNGVTEITMAAGGGWALELNLIGNSVNEPFWKEQK